MSYPKILFILFDMNYETLHNNKSSIFNSVEDTIILNFNVEYRFSGIIACHSFNLYNAIIFNPLGWVINKKFCANYIYYHDGNANDGNITQFNPFENWKDIGIPYIVIYKIKE